MSKKREQNLSFSSVNKPSFDNPLTDIEEDENEYATAPRDKSNSNGSLE